VGGLSSVITRPGANAVTALVLGACLVLGLMTVFTSPLIYNPGQHVTGEMMSGYEDGFDHGAEDVPYAGMGYDPYRYDHGINGLSGGDTISGASAATGSVNATVFSGELQRGLSHRRVLFRRHRLGRVAGTRRLP